MHSGYMVGQGTIGRFMRWGMTHGPLWGVLAALISGLPLVLLTDLPVDEVTVVLVALGGGIVAGPVLGFAAGLACLAADRAPKWLLDAPDYVAVAAVAGIVGGIAWPVLELGRAGPAPGILAVALIASVPAVDAARNAPRLLHPAGSGDYVATTVDMAARGQAS